MIHGKRVQQKPNNVVLLIYIMNNIIAFFKGLYNKYFMRKKRFSEKEMLKK